MLQVEKNVSMSFGNENMSTFSMRKWIGNPMGSYLRQMNSWDGANNKESKLYPYGNQFYFLGKIQVT